ncbi:MarR family winged helix-turn-helix transcriptional regulator [Clostridium aminobutyricum]|uniref:MarR family transcriptional regulator n=1 Tax=Clostridium aminobutyricum TaxID=33953 RepID=A0A939D9A1_CLOAM|nr:MarR family transcriptional regulator [Clostridium aminobutyricum]MBN7773450.1 MarR family transcriptional regulator [Clostridium aminobutyricum]
MGQYDKLKLENQLCFSLYAASREVIKLYKPLLDNYNLTYTQYVVMLVLWEEQKITVKQLGEKLHLDSGTLSPLLKKLEKMDLIIKYRDKADDRVVNVEVTEKAKALKEKIVEVPEQLFCKFDSEMEELVQLKKLLDNLLIRLD